LIIHGQGRKYDEVLEEHKLEGLLEEKVVDPVEKTLLGLKRDTVYWQQGLLASPSVGFEANPTESRLQKKGELLTNVALTNCHTSTATFYALSIVSLGRSNTLKLINCQT